MSDGDPAGDSERGEGDATFPTKADIALWRRAFRENWPISDSDRNQIIRDCMDAFILSDSARDKVNLAKVIMLGDSLNVKRASMIGQAMKSESSPVVINNAVTVGIQQVASQEPEYLEWLRERGLAGRGDADAVGANGFRAELPDAAPHLGFRPGDNGHDSGA